MQILYDTGTIVRKAAKSIEKYGRHPEHNIYYYLNSKCGPDSLALFDFGKHKTILSSFRKNSGTWCLLPSAIFSPDDEKSSLLEIFISYCLTQANAGKVAIEVEESLYRGIGKVLDMDKFKVSRISYAYMWPVADLKEWNGSLDGGKWRKLRKTVKGFYRNNDISLLSCSKFTKDQLTRIVSNWKERRKGRDRALCRQYMNFIESGFSGTDYAMSISIGNEPCTIAAGWKVPNTNSFYLGIMLHDYRCDGLGETMYVESFNHLRNLGMEYVEMGGSGPSLLSFKEKFHPSNKYRTVEFSVRKVQ